MTPSITVSSITASEDFYLAAGTVTIDTSTSKVLLIRDRTTGRYKLPRGRKDWGETLETTAQRETYEETGVRCKLLPVQLRTRATPPRDHPQAAAALFDGTGDVVSGVSLREPIAVMQHFQTNGALAIVFFYVATADSSAPQAEGTQMTDEDYEAKWVGFKEVARLLTDPRYAEVVAKGIELAGSPGESDMKPSMEKLVTNGKIL
ncbi:hypothetical protein NKR23_g204 [Pleurostoma richardsiae]|uniref:Nudix hydrolase domain-containing protein n=1 Tax=Pleurostoma richardsiae TaxID=41990 RepID=A0AA38VLP5_9PEZI|nr:hypothetical protein NKR23_g204 [Pleurostoma richardsiae]